MFKKFGILISIVCMVSCSSTKKLKTGTLMEMNSEEFLIQNNSWNLQSTENFKFYFDKEIAESFRKEVINAQQNNYKSITQLMGIEQSKCPKITFFLFKDKEQKKLLTQLDGDAHAINPNVYYLPKNAKGRQEIGHVITQTVWGFIANSSEYGLLIDEGFNFYIDNEKAYNGKLDEYALNYIESTQDFEITELTKNGKGLRNSNGGHRLNESYVAGSFVKYLIEEYGSEKFGALWESAVKYPEPAFKNIYGKDLSQIGNDFTNSLK